MSMSLGPCDRAAEDGHNSHPGHGRKPAVSDNLDVCLVSDFEKQGRRNPFVLLGSEAS